MSVYVCKATFPQKSLRLKGLGQFLRPSLWLDRSVWKEKAMFDFDRAMLLRAAPRILAARAQAVLDEERRKGCSGELCSAPVALEPLFGPINAPRKLLGETAGAVATAEPKPAAEDLIRYRVWISPDQAFDWTRSEMFLKPLALAQSRIGFEVAGNENEIQIIILCHRSDAPIVQAAFQGEFESCALVEQRYTNLSLFPPHPGQGSLLLFDLFPEPPYFHLLTQPSELRLSPYESLIAALAKIPQSACGFSQVLFQRVSPQHNLNDRVEALLDLEFMIKLGSGFQLPQRYLQQQPSGELHQKSRETEAKAHNDKPFFCAAYRIGLVDGGPHSQELLLSLVTFSGLFQHGGKPWNHLTEADYARVIDPTEFHDLLALGLTYRPGFLVNSSELTGLAHLPPATIFAKRRMSSNLLEPLPPKSDALLVGCLIGFCERAGESIPIRLSPEMRFSQVHLLGRQGKGKSTLMERMVMSDVLEGHGLAVLDPHGDLVEKLLRLIPEQHVERTIYFNPADPAYVPLWSVLHRSQSQDIGWIADDLVSSFKDIVEGWGVRLETLLRNAFLGLLAMPNPTLLDAMDLLRKDSKEGERLRNRVCEMTGEDAVRKFWREDFKGYRNEELMPPQNRLFKLVSSGTVALMLSQPQNLINSQRIMDEGKVLLVDLSGISSENRNLLGCFMLSQFYHTALSRSAIPEDARRPFFIYVDECHRFMSAILQNAIVELRKFKVGLCLAHQYITQVTRQQADALSGVGTTVIFKVDMRDAQYLKKDLCDLVTVEDLITQERGHAIARIGNEIVRVKTLGPMEVPERSFRTQIIAESHRRYYKPVAEVRAAIRRRGDRWNKPFSPLTSDTGNQNDYGTL